MKRKPPFDQSSNPAATYSNGNAVAGIDGSIPDAAFFNDIYDEILEVITFAGLTPSDGDHKQLREAIQAMMPTPSGAPSDASLVHVADDTGTANALVLAPSPTMASLAKGAIVLTWPAAAAAPGAATVAITIAGSPVTKSLARDDNSALVAGDVVAGRLTLLQYDGTKFRVLGCRRAVAVDGTTVTGDGVSSPLSAVQPLSGFGVGINQTVAQLLDVPNRKSPDYAGFAVGMQATAAQIQGFSWPGVDVSKVSGATGINSPNYKAWVGAYGDPHSNDVNGVFTGTWELEHWAPMVSALTGTTYYLYWKRLS